jgi:hypothetical protein
LTDISAANQVQRKVTHAELILLEVNETVDEFRKKWLARRKPQITVNQEKKVKEN